MVFLTGSSYHAWDVTLVRYRVVPGCTNDAAILADNRRVLQLLVDIEVDYSGYGEILTAANKKCITTDSHLSQKMPYRRHCNEDERTANVMHGRIQRGGWGKGSGPPPPLKHHKKYRVSLQYWSGSPEKSQSFQASICPPSKRWWADDDPFKAVYGSSIPPSTKKKKKKKKKTLSNLDPL